MGRGESRQFSAINAVSPGSKRRFSALTASEPRVTQILPLKPGSVAARKRANVVAIETKPPSLMLVSQHCVLLGVCLGYSICFKT